MVASVFHNRRWDGDFLTLRRLMSEGALGELVRLESRFDRWRPEVDQGKWREGGDPEDAGGLLFDLGPHLIDQALDLFGPARSVYAEVRRLRPGAAVDDDIFLALEHSSGACSHLAASMLAAQPGPRLRALGSRAAYVKWGLDVQEEALESGARPGEPGFGEDPPEAWGLLGTEDGAQPLQTEPGRYVEFYERMERAIRAGAAAAGAARGRHRHAARDRGGPGQRRAARRRSAVTRSSLLRAHRCAARAYGRRSCRVRGARRASSGSGSCSCSRWPSWRSSDSRRARIPKRLAPSCCTRSAAPHAAGARRLRVALRRAARAPATECDPRPDHAPRATCRAAWSLLLRSCRSHRAVARRPPLGRARSPRRPLGRGRFRGGSFAAVRSAAGPGVAPACSGGGRGCSASVTSVSVTGF